MKQTIFRGGESIQFAALRRGKIRGGGAANPLDRLHF